MRLYRCSKVDQFLYEERLVDERKLWCYAQMKASSDNDLNSYYGLVLVCIKLDRLFIFVSRFNDVELELFCSCAISEMKCIRTKKGWMSTRLSFSVDNRHIQLDLDDWKRLSVGLAPSDMRQ